MNRYFSKGRGLVKSLLCAMITGLICFAAPAYAAPVSASLSLLPSIPSPIINTDVRQHVRIVSLSFGISTI